MDGDSTDQASTDTSTGTSTDSTDSAVTDKSADKPKVSGNTNDAINSNLDDIEDVDVLKSMVKSLRVENGNHRKKNKDLASELDSAKEWKLQNLKAVSDAEDRVAKADAVAKRYVVRTIQSELDIDDDLVDLITGDTEDELWEKGQKLANTKKKDSGVRNPLDPGWVPGPTNLMAGKRGEPVKPAKRPGPRSGEGEDSSWLRGAWYR